MTALPILSRYVHCMYKCMLCTEHACIILFNVYRFVKILFDELYIRQDLVYDWHSSRLLGFVNLGEVDRQLADLELSTSGDTPEVSTRILTLMVRVRISCMKLVH